MRLLVREKVAVLLRAGMTPQRDLLFRAALAAAWLEPRPSVSSLHTQHRHPPPPQNQDREGSGGQRRCWIPGAQMKI